MYLKTAPERVSRWSVGAADVYTTLTIFLFSACFLSVCLRGAQPCTINPVSYRQTLLCLLFCCWLPQTYMWAVVPHAAFSPLCLVKVHSGRCLKGCSEAQFGALKEDNKLASAQFAADKL